MITLSVVAYLWETLLLSEDLADYIFHDFSLSFSFPFLPLLQLCYLYSDLYKQTNSKETRRVFLEFHQFFLDRSAVSYQVNITSSALSYVELLVSYFQSALIFLDIIVLDFLTSMLCLSYWLLLTVTLIIFKLVVGSEFSQ